MNDLVICPHCEYEQRDIHNGGDPCEWWTGKDQTFHLKCDECGKPFELETYWIPNFKTYKYE